MPKLILTWLYVLAAIATIIASVVTVAGAPDAVWAKMGRVLPIVMIGARILAVALAAFCALSMLWFRRKAVKLAKELEGIVAQVGSVRSGNEQLVKAAQNHTTEIAEITARYEKSLGDLSGDVGKWNRAYSETVEQLATVKGQAAVDQSKAEARGSELQKELDSERAGASVLRNNSREDREEIHKLKELFDQVAVPDIRHPKLTLQKRWYELVGPDASNIHYKDKIRFIVTSNYADTISVWAPLWRSNEVVYQPPLAALFQMEGPKGWRADDWEKDEHACITLKPGQSFKGWIGLSPPAGEGLEVRVNKGTTGQLVFPIKVEGKLGQESVSI